MYCWRNFVRTCEIGRGWVPNFVRTRKNGQGWATGFVRTCNNGQCAVRNFVRACQNVRKFCTLKIWRRNDELQIRMRIKKLNCNERELKWIRLFIWKARPPPYYITNTEAITRPVSFVFVSLRLFVVLRLLVSFHDLMGSCSSLSLVKVSIQTCIFFCENWPVDSCSVGSCGVSVSLSSCATGAPVRVAALVVGATALWIVSGTSDSAASSIADVVAVPLQKGEHLALLRDRLWDEILQLARPCRACCSKDSVAAAASSGGVCLPCVN